MIAVLGEITLRDFPKNLIAEGGAVSDLDSGHEGEKWVPNPQYNL